MSARPLPLVSVVLATRNRAAALRTTLGSILAQDYPALEVIVTDDDSSDDTAAVLASAAADDDRIRTLHQPRRSGAAAARNRAAASATGELIALSDDDCTWQPGKVREQVEALTRADAGVCYCRIELRGAGGVRLEGSPPPAGRPFRVLLLRNWVGPTPVVVVRRDAFERAGGFDETLPRLIDWDLWLRLAQRERFAYVPQVLLSTDPGREGISTDAPALEEAAARLLAKWEPLLTRADLARLSYGIAHDMLTHGAAGSGRRLLRRSAALNPLQLRAWGALALSLAGLHGRAVRAIERRRAGLEAQ